MMIFHRSTVLSGLMIFLFSLDASAQAGRMIGDSTVFTLGKVEVTFSHQTGTLSYRFQTGMALVNTVAFVELLNSGTVVSTDFQTHTVRQEAISDSLGRGERIVVTHESAREVVRLVQTITAYEGQPAVQVRLEVTSTSSDPIETRYISPLAILPAIGGQGQIPCRYARLVDVPFDNDNWVKLLAQPWPKKGEDPFEGVSHEFAAVYDTASNAGLVVGSLEHDFWKTGIAYRSGVENGILDSLVVYGGAARRDHPNLPPEHGGYDGTHDYTAHGSMVGHKLSSPLIYVEGGSDFRQSLTHYGQTQVKIVGASKWEGSAPVYWNSFGVESVLGHEGIMMPRAVRKISDFMHRMRHFSMHSKPVLSIDSYDQEIYSTTVLRDIGKYGAKNGQQMGFYCSPFSLWTWKNNLDNAKLPGLDVALHEVILRDELGNYVPYKDGEWGAFPLDPTHPATRLSIIKQIEKAKAIGATFIKIDFLTAGSLESTVRYDKRVRTGMQAYHYGMKMLRHVIDSIMGPNVFITQAISPMFPHQFAHTRFVSTDVHSHLRDNQPGFPHYGSAAASMITASHMGWVQGTLWPYTNMDVLVMKKFQQHPPLRETEVKVRLYCLMVMGSILGDGSDFRDKLSQERAAKFLNHPAVAAYFAHPRAFIPFRLAEGVGMDQQLSFYLPGDPMLISMFNFSLDNAFVETFRRQDVGLPEGAFEVVDFLTNQKLAAIQANQTAFTLSAPTGDALLVKLIRK